MSYIGNDPNQGSFFIQKFTGDSTTTSFGLNQNITDGSQLLVTIGNVVQEEGSGFAYTASGNTLVFSEAPANGDKIVVRFLGVSLATPTSYTNAVRFRYIATSGQTVFTGEDSNGATLDYTINNIDVYLNGVRLDQSDFTQTNTSTITLASGAATSDELVIVVFKVIQIASAGGGMYKGDSGTINSAGAADIFRVHQAQLDTNTTIESTENAIAAGPLTIAANKTLTIQGNLSIV